METRRPSFRLMLTSVGFVLLCLVLLFGVFIKIGGSVPFGPQGYRVSIPFTQATNLVPGSQVDVSGVPVGRVVGIERVGNAARARIQIQSTYAPLHAGTIAIQRTKTLLGEGYIELSLGSRHAAPIPDGSVLPVRSVRGSVQLDQFLSAFGAGTRARMQQLFGGLASAYGGAEQALNDSLSSVAPLAQNLDAVLGTLQLQSVSLQGLLSNSGDVLAAVGNRDGTLRAAVSSGNQLFAATAARSRALGQMIRALPPFLTQLHETATTVTTASPTINAAVGALEPTSALLPASLRFVDTDAPVFRALFHELPATLSAGRRALPALTPMLDATDGALKQFYPLARNIIPIAQLIAAYPSLWGILGNIGAVTSGPIVGPRGIVRIATTGIPTIWNETLSGWTKKLPTNRQNPYPEPDALVQEGRNGYLKSYDCRNIHNPLVIPPTGNGAPPCVLQGPWTFDGRTAYYPRLLIAPK